MLTILAVLWIVALVLVIMSAMGKIPDWAWGLCILVILALMIFPGGQVVR